MILLYNILLSHLHPLLYRALQETSLPAPKAQVRHSTEYSELDAAALRELTVWHCMVLLGTVWYCVGSYETRICLPILSSVTMLRVGTP